MQVFVCVRVCVSNGMVSLCGYATLTTIEATNMIWQSKETFKIEEIMSIALFAATATTAAVTAFVAILLLCSCCCFKQQID